LSVNADNNSTCKPHLENHGDHRLGGQGPVQTYMLIK